jgi:hypothetical protein
MVIGMSFFGQWSGNNVVSYFMPEMIKEAGILDPNKQLLINAINPIFSMMGAVYGATLLDKLGRRTMMLAGLTGGLFSYILLTAFTASTASNPSLSYGVIVSIFLIWCIICMGVKMPLFFHNLCLATNMLQFHTPSNPLRSGMPRKPHPRQRLRIELPILKHSNGGQHVRHQRRHPSYWMEIIYCIYRLDLCRDRYDIFILCGDGGEDTGGDGGDFRGEESEEGEY